MNLKSYLLSRIIGVALLCLVATVVYALQRSEQQSRQRVFMTADSVAKQLEFQLLRIRAGYRSPDPFPDFNIWQQASPTPGICLRFVSSENHAIRGLCHGDQPVEQPWPSSFALVYRLFFGRELQETRRIRYQGRVFGELTVSFSEQMMLANAWTTVSNLLGLSALTIFAVSLLVYWVVDRALRPAHSIVTGLRRMEHGEPEFRLPEFDLIEWRQTAKAINHLVDQQQQSLSERQKLAVQLMDLQEDERRYLARELHDEFGQCLTAINAVAASVARTAEQECPALIADAKQISRFGEHLMDSLRRVLLRLRPAELDELGLAASLNSLVAQWNKVSRKTRYHLKVAGDCKDLSATLAITLFRIIQEGLTNIARHASASQAIIRVRVERDRVSISIQDDGIAARLPFAGRGVGIQGMRERIDALNGQLNLSIAEPHGLILEVWLPTGIAGCAQE